MRVPAGTLTISGSGDIPDFATSTNTPWNELSKTHNIYKIIIENGVTSIGNNAFYGTSALSVSLPDTLKSIGNSAFCESQLTTAIIPSGVTTIGDKAFYKCPNLDHMDIPEGVTSIGASVFQSCDGLTSVNLPASIETVGAAAFTGCGKLMSILFAPSREAKVVNIGASAFTQCWYLSMLVLPKIDRISSGMFEGSGISYMIIPDGTTKIEDFAFTNCRGLQAVWIPKSVTDIGSRPFQGCSALTSVYYAGSQSDWSTNMPYSPPSTVLTATSAKIIYDSPHDHTPYLHDISSSDPAWGSGSAVTMRQCWACGYIEQDADDGTFTEPTDPNPPSGDHTDHTWDEGEVTTPATCTQEGVKTFTCTVCKHTKTEPIPATGIHTYGEYTVKTPATCINDGVKVRTCTVCGSEDAQTEVIPATGIHTYGEYTVKTPATCINDGVKVRTCTVCGSEDAQTEVIPATGIHTYGEYRETKAPTCTEDGVKTRTCTVCGSEDEKTEAIPATGHDFPDTSNENGNYTCQHGCGTVVSPDLKDGYEAVKDSPLTNGTAESYFDENSAEESISEIVSGVLKSSNSQCTVESIEIRYYEAPSRTSPGHCVYMAVLRDQQGKTIKLEPFSIEFSAEPEGNRELELLKYADQYSAESSWEKDGTFTLSVEGKDGNTITTENSPFKVLLAEYNKSDKKMTRMREIAPVAQGDNSIAYPGTLFNENEKEYKLFMLDKQDSTPVIKARSSESIQGS